MGLKQTGDSSCHRPKHIQRGKKGAQFTLLRMNVTQDENVKTDACSTLKLSRCSFTTYAIHVPDLYNCMSNQKIVLLLHFIRENKSLNLGTTGPLIESMCCVLSSFN